ncbi:MAG: L-threonylcarbamoyladenylate synthase [Patescibacteria group bacterium]|nr:L-threonylcarbamoyladenylate synthase [Patescibacteria group bacterium]
MLILEYDKKNHSQIIKACVSALRQGKVVAYPTDTSYGLAADTGNITAIKKLYQIKQREKVKPVHVVVPSVAYAKKIVHWNSVASKLAKEFWPGPLTIILPLKSKGLVFTTLSAGTGFLGVRMPNNKIALDLSRILKMPITTPSANPPSGMAGDDSYSADEVVRQFAGKKYKPDIIINAGSLPKRKPSTMVKIDNGQIFVLRKGPVSEKQINKVFKK